MKKFKEGVVLGAGIMVGFLLIAVGVKLIKQHVPVPSTPTQGPVALF